MLCSLLSRGNNPFIISKKFYSVEDGLVGKQVYCGLQDSWGFIWLGTQHGLQRYDGKNFKLYTKEKNGLQSNNVVQLAEDSLHRLWITYGQPGTNRYSLGKIDIMNLESETVVSFTQLFSNALPFKESNIEMVKANSKKELLIVTNSPNGNLSWIYSASTGFKKQKALGLFGNYEQVIFGDSIIAGNYADSALIQSFYNTTLPDLKTKSKQQTELHTLGISAKGKLFIIESDNYYSKPITDKSIPANIYEWNDDGSIVKSSMQFFNKVEPKAERNWYDRFHNAATGTMLIYSLYKGLYLFDGKQFVQLLDSVQISNYNRPRIYSYFVTNKNQHWLCTEYGLIEITLKQNFFSHILSTDVIKFNLNTDHQVRSIFADSSGIYAVCWDGFYKIVKSNEGQFQYQLVMDKKMIAQGDGFYFDNSEFWVTPPKGNYVAKLNPASGKIKLTDTESKGVWTGIRTSDNKLILGNVNHLISLTDTVFKKINYCNSNQEVNAWIYQFVTTSEKKLWAVSNKGILEFDGNCIAAQYNAEQKNIAYKIPYTDLHALYEDKKGTVWLATNGAGLIKWNRKENSFKQYTVADGLSSNVLYSVLEDEKGFFWISSEFGLMRFDPLSGFVKTYTTDDGLTENEFNRISYFKAANGQMFFGGLNGINAFFPNDLWSDTSAFNLPMRIVSCNQFIGDENSLADKTVELIKTNSITLNPGDKFFTLEFQLLDFEEGRHRYAYKIEGVDKDWNYISENSIRLSGLPYGDFKLRIKGQNFEGQWSKNELTIPLNVITPFYKTGWFYIVAALLVVAIVFIISRWRTRNLEKANAMLEDTVGKRTLQLQDSLKQKEVLLKEIHHRVKNNLQVISSLLELQSANLENSAAKAALIEGQARVRSIALIHHQLYQHDNLGEIEFSGFLAELYKQVESVFKIESHVVETSYHIPETYFDIDTIVPLGLLANELFTNSFKYAFSNDTNGKIAISLTKLEKGNYLLTYTDNGGGLPSDFNLQKATSLGLRLVFRLGKQLGGNVTYDKPQNTFSLHFKDSTTRKQNE